jgi:hypothetical protein
LPTPPRWVEHDCIDFLNQQIFKEKYSGSRLLSKRRAYRRKVVGSRTRPSTSVGKKQKKFAAKPEKTMKPQQGRVVSTTGVVRAIGYKEERARITLISVRSDLDLRYVFLVEKAKLRNTNIGSSLRIVLIGEDKDWLATELKVIS